MLLCIWISADQLGINQRILTWVEQQWGAQAQQRLRQWQTLVAEQQNTSEAEKLRAVNQFFNQMTFVDDEQHWGREDYWATPIEFLASNGGDCEDFSIAKYFTLKAVGVSMNKLRITYVKALRLNQAHMVLTYFPEPGADPLVLDNIIAIILPASQRQDLRPVYSFNGDGLWLSKSRNASKRLGGADDLNLWRDFRLRMEQLGKP